MSIQLTPVTSLNLFGVKKNFEKIGKEAWSLQKTRNADYTSTIPTTDTLAEGQAIYYSVDAGTNIILYMNVGNAIRKVSLTNE